MEYSTENKSPVFWIGGAGLAYLALGPVALAGVGLMYWGKHCRTVCEVNGWIDDPRPVPRLASQWVQVGLRAVDVAAVEVPDSRGAIGPTISYEDAEPAPTVVPQNRIAPDVLSDRLQSFASKGRNLFIVAKPGAGKGVFLSNYIRWRKQAQSALHVFVIDPKNDPRERGYWAEPWITHIGFRADVLPTDDLVLELQSAFDEYVSFCRQRPDLPVLLIVDEALLITEVLNCADDKGTKNLLKGQITRVGSVGDSHDRHIVVVSQSPNSGDVSVSAGTLKMLDKVCILKEDQAEVIQHGAKFGGFSLDRPPTNAEVAHLCRKSPVGRAIFIGGELVPMPKLENYSGWNRDDRRFEGAVQSGSEIGSGAVQARFSGSEIGSTLNRGSETIQALNRPEINAFSDSVQTGSAVQNHAEPLLNHSEPLVQASFFTNLNLNRKDAIDRIQGLQESGMNQSQIILALWNARKGGSKSYAEAIAQYRDLMGE